jgi:hypothetical protein
MFVILQVVLLGKDTDGAYTNVVPEDGIQFSQMRVGDSTESPKTGVRQDDGKPYEEGPKDDSHFHEKECCNSGEGVKTGGQTDGDITVGAEYDTQFSHEGGGQGVGKLSGGPQDGNQFNVEEACNSYEDARTVMQDDGDTPGMVAGGNIFIADEGGEVDNQINADEGVKSGEADNIGCQEDGETGRVGEDGNKFTDEEGGNAESLKIRVEDGELQDTHPPSIEFFIFLISFFFEKNCIRIFCICF